MSHLRNSPDTKALELWLPRPPSVNGLYVNNPKTGGRFPAKAYKEWQQEAAISLWQQPRHLVPGPVEVRYIFGRKNKIRSDVFNFEKALSDFLVKMGIIEDDSLIQRGSVEWHTGSEGVKIFIRPLDTLL